MAGPIVPVRRNGRYMGVEAVWPRCWSTSAGNTAYYSWSKEFMEAGEKRLAGNTAPGGH